MSAANLDTLQYVHWWFRGTGLYKPAMSIQYSPAPGDADSTTTTSPWANQVSRLVPRSLFAQVTLIIVIGLMTAQFLTFASIRYERGVAMTQLMMSGLEQDIASSVAILDRLPPGERIRWLGRLERPNYRFSLGGSVQGEQPRSAHSRRVAGTIAKALYPFGIVAIAEGEEPEEGLRIQVRITDGSTVIVQSKTIATRISTWILWVLLVQLGVLIVCARYAVRMVTLPLVELARAADALGPDLKARTLPEAGPTEVAHAAHAFNAMQRRITGYMAERVEILAAISHDLQTPITRMQLRTELMAVDADRTKFRQDLDAMNALVREGVAYARTLHGGTEPACLVDADALLESLVSDYEEAGAKLLLEGHVGRPLMTRPLALRRILTNLLDNALKFGADVRLRVCERAGFLVIDVLDDGPGIPPEHLQAVLQPFYRVESSRNRSTGGTGLGLAIAHQLALAMGGELRLQNRPEGGLEARISIAMAAS